LNLFLEDWFRV